MKMDTGNWPDEEANTQAGLTGAAEPFGFRAETDESLPTGTDLGGLRIVRLVGEGGMGRVYEAEQATPRRTVAVKFMRDALVSTGALHRFEREADVLARLHHPHIAQIHAVGSFVQGSLSAPYFVMEFVPDAQPITAFARDRGLSIRDRVGLFRVAAAAVAHGHACGVIHRDLKPGNVLVGANGEPKVIDFGIARALDAREGPTATATGELIGTLDAMSPEQLGALPDAEAVSIDARTDVYSLGLLLRDLVTDGPGDGLFGLCDATQVIATRSARARSAVAAACGRERALSAADGRSLAAIVGTCLEQAPAERYATAADLVADLDRWLADEPVRARPPAWHESARRWARRHRAAAFAGVGILAAVVAGIVGVGFFYLESVAQRNAAEAQLYLATVARAEDARDRGLVADATRLVAEARRLASPVGEGRSPIELACLASALDESIDSLPGHSGGLATVAVSRDGRWAVTGSVDGTARVWQLGARGNAATVLRGHEGAIWGIGFSPDAAMVATGSADKTVRLWETATGRPLATLRGHTSTVYTVEFLPDGRGILSGSRDKTVRLWDVASRETTRVYTGHDGTVYSLAITADGTRLATASLDKTVRLWDPATGEETGRIEGHDGRVFSVTFSPDASRLATASQDGTARLWDTATLAAIATIPHPVRVNAVAFSADGRLLATAAGDQVLRIWSGDDGREVRRFLGHQDWIWSVAALPEGGRFLTASADATARIWDASGAADPVVTLGSRVLTTAFDPAGHLAALGTANGTMAICDAVACRERSRLDLEAGRVNAVAFSPDGARVAAACDEAALVLAHDGGRASAPERCEGHTGRVHAVSFSGDGTRLLTASADRSARIWDAGTRRELTRLKHPGRVYAAVYSPDGSRIATACDDGVVRLFDARTGNAVKQFTGHAKQVNWVAFAPDGSALASVSSDATARIWPLERGRTPPVLSGAAGQLWKVAWSPDSARVAAASADGAVHLWDVATGRQVATLRGHRDEVWAVAFAPDGGTILSGSFDTTARLWGVSPAELVRRRLAGE